MAKHAGRLVDSVDMVRRQVRFDVARAGWDRYGRALHSAMAEVLAEFPEGGRPHAIDRRHRLNLAEV
jgi:plasmid stabilization system protein ParE